MKQRRVFLVVSLISAWAMLAASQATAGTTTTGLIYVQADYGIESDLSLTYVEFRASLAAPAQVPVAFSYSTPTNGCISTAEGQGCASPGSDYLDSAGTVVFAPGETAKSFFVPIVPDDFPERANEIFPVDLWAPVNALFAVQEPGWGRLAQLIGEPAESLVEGRTGLVWGNIADDDGPSQDTTAPTQPTGLTAEALKGRKIELSWNESTDLGGSGLAGYRVERSGGGSSFTLIAITTTTSYTDSGLTKGTTYGYRVTACDHADNCSQPSNTAIAKAMK